MTALSRGGFSRRDFKFVVAAGNATIYAKAVSYPSLSSQAKQGDPTVIFVLLQKRGSLRNRISVVSEKSLCVKLPPRIETAVWLISRRYAGSAQVVRDSEVALSQRRLLPQDVGRVSHREHFVY